MNRFFKSLVFLLSISTSSFAGGPISEVVEPLIQRCPEFISGNAQIKLDPGGYSVWEGGRHNYRFICYIPALSILNKENARDTIVAEGFSKVGDATDSPSADNDPSANNAECSGSKIILDSRSLGEEVAITGAPFKLVYFSHRALGYFADSTITVPIDGTNPNVTGIQVTGGFADNQIINQFFVNVPGQKFVFQWNNLNSSGQYIQGSVDLNFDVIYTIYGKQVPVRYSKRIGGWKSALMKIGGWQPSIYHFYDFKRNLLVDANSNYAKINYQQNGSEFWVPTSELAEIYVFDSNGKHLRTMHGLTGQNKFIFNHDSEGLLTSIVDEYGQVTAFNRDSITKNVVSIVSSKGQTTHLEYSRTNLLVSITDPIGHSYEMTYKGVSGLLETFRKPEGELSTFTYTANGLLIKDQHSGGFLSILSQETDRLQYAIKRVIKESAMGRKVIREIQNALETVGESHAQTTYPDGTSDAKRVGVTVTSQAESGTGNSSLVSYRTDPRFNNGKYEARSSNLIMSNYYLTDTTKRATILNNNPFDIQNMTITSQRVDDVTAQSYSGHNRTWTVTSPNGIVTKKVINENEKPVMYQVGNYLPIQFAYNADGTVRQIAQGQRKTFFEYDQNGYLKQQTNSVGHLKRFKYNAVGDLISLTEIDGRTTNYTYDKNRRLIKLNLPHGQVHQFKFDSNEQLASYIPPWISADSAVTYSYNLDRQMTGVGLPDGRSLNYVYGDEDLKLTLLTATDSSTSYQYDLHSRTIPSQIFKSDFPSGNNITTTRDYLIGNTYRTEDYNISLSSGTAAGKVEYKFDEKFRVNQINIFDGINSAPSLVYYKHNADDQVTHASFERLSYEKNSGKLSSKELFNAKLVYKYNPNYGDLEKIDFQYTNKSRLVQEFKHDLLGRISEINTGIPQTILYDKAGRLTGRVEKATGIPLSNYVYDNNGNRIRGEEDGVSFIATYDSQDRVITFNSNSYSYNLNGQLQTKVNPSGTTTYSFDTLGNLSAVSTPSKTIQYVIDGYGRRVAKIENGVITRYYLWQGQLKLVAELNGSGQLIKRYVYTNNEHSPDYMLYQGNYFIFIKDHRGSILNVMNARTGQVMQSMKYSDWGKVIQDSNPGFQSFGFAGGMYEPDTGLVHFGAREYDAEIGRWISKDPILFEGGDTNLYGYVLQDPMNGIDPAGLKTWGIGITTGGTSGGVTVSTDTQVVWDDKGNIGIATTICGGGTTDVGNFYSGFISSSGDAATTSDLSGDSGSAGGSYSFGKGVSITAGGAVCSGSDSKGNRTTTTSGMIGVSVGVSPVNVGGSACTTTVIPIN